MKVQPESIGVGEESVVRYRTVDRGVVEDLVNHVGKAVKKAVQKKKLWLVCE